MTAIRRPNGRVILADRAISGMQAHGRYWDGPMILVAEPNSEAELSADRDRMLGGANMEVDPKELPFELVVADFHGPEARRALARMDVSIVGIGYRAVHLAKWGQEVGTPVIFGSEYTLQTRLQIVRVETPNLLRQARRIAWELDLERRERDAIRIAAGIQCSGVPTWKAYKNLNPNSMLFFDGRMDEEMLVDDEHQAARHERLRSGEPFKLAWSGRLNKMKGADQLPAAAARLKSLGVPFTLDIYGGGVLEEEIRQQVATMGLADQVKVHGFVNFYEVLTPLMQKEVDIWLCPHPQGDPSGAYMESFGYGLPIIGFGNEALAGLLELVDAGRTVPVDDPDKLADAVAEAHRNRERVVRWSSEARSFAAEHTFSKSFARRMRHLDAILAVKAFQH